FLEGDVHALTENDWLADKNIYPAINCSDCFAIAVDVGTTSVKITLVNLSQGTEINIPAFLNPQRRFGHDVISRIAAAKDSKANQTMTRQIRQRIFKAITNALNATALPPGNIKQIVFSGNTTMLYLFFGLDVTRLGVYPFHAEQIDFDDVTYKDIDADLFPKARISALPAISAFLGGDLVGGMTLCREKGFREHTFFIDLGTNGELFIVNGSGATYAASCAMGPALEGMSISWGMTADEGAITHVRLDDGSLVYSMLGKGLPVGLTGTALIDLVSIFLTKGVIREDGAFASDIDNRQLPHPARYSDGLKSKQIRIWGDIAISQIDIRNLQLAKGASLAASGCLLNEAGCREKDIRNVLIAGAFGSHLDLDHFRRLGFIPQFPRADYHYLGNTSLQAAGKACVDDLFIDEAARLRDSVTEIELASNPDFNRKFIVSMNFGNFSKR
ncbi:MAG: DUF4445 domain-containing protein, partial [Deltaproteobacteria bacterium]|nr:DUF4445 domain-containing protein [Deltaproteobacteria bacterium]